MSAASPRTRDACAHPAHALTDIRRLATSAGPDPVHVARCDLDRGGCGYPDVRLGLPDMPVTREDLIAASWAVWGRLPGHPPAVDADRSELLAVVLAYMAYVVPLIGDEPPPGRDPVRYGAASPGWYKCRMCTWERRAEHPEWRDAPERCPSCRADANAIRHLVADRTRGR